MKKITFAIIAVSYTHLDVYKRQGLEGANLQIPEQYLRSEQI